MKGVDARNFMKALCAAFCAFAFLAAALAAASGLGRGRLRVCDCSGRIVRGREGLVSARCVASWNLERTPLSSFGPPFLNLKIGEGKGECEDTA